MTSLFSKQDVVWYYCITLLAPMNESMKIEAENLEKQNGNISIKSIKPYSSSIKRPYTTFVVDKKHSLAIS